MPAVYRYPSSINAISAANTAVTLTIPAAGVGKRNYITRLTIRRIATAGVIGNSLLTITTTDWPGNVTWRTGNLIQAGQMIIDLDALFDPPVQQVTTNTAVTIVCPAGGATVFFALEAHFFTD